MNLHNFPVPVSQWLVHALLLARDICEAHVLDCLGHINPVISIWLCRGSTRRRSYVSCRLCDNDVHAPSQTGPSRDVHSAWIPELSAPLRNPISLWKLLDGYHILHDAFGVQIVRPGLLLLRWRH